MEPERRHENGTGEKGEGGRCRRKTSEVRN